MAARQRSSPGLPPAATPQPSQSSQPYQPSQQSLDELARYARTGVVPPPKADNRGRFKSFVDRINRRQWEFLGDVVQGSLSYNKDELSLYELTLLLKHEFAPKTNVTMEVATAVGGDGSLDGGGPVAARLRIKTVTAEAPYVSSAARRHHSEYARHMLVYFTDNKISRIYDISDSSEKPSPGPTVVPPPSSHPPPPVSVDLRQFYADYIACINSGRMAADLDQFCHPSGVVWNGTRMSVRQYGYMIQSSLDAISGLFFDIHTLVVDEGRQQVAARLEFTGTPVKPFAGAVPNGRPVAFAEHVFYWLEQGKISDVLSIVDWEEYRAQLAR